MDPKLKIKVERSEGRHQDENARFIPQRTKEAYDYEDNLILLFN